MSTKAKKAVKNVVPKVKLSETAIAADAARALEMKEARKAERAAAKAAVQKGSKSGKKYSTQVEAAITNFLNAPAAVNVPWTEAREKEADIKIHLERIAELKTEIGTASSLLRTYEVNLKILQAELAELSTTKTKTKATSK